MEQKKIWRTEEDGRTLCTVVTPNGNSWKKKKEKMLQGGVHPCSKYVLSLEMAGYQFFFSNNDTHTETLCIS